MIGIVLERIEKMKNNKRKKVLHCILLKVCMFMIMQKQIYQANHRKVKFKKIQ